MTDACFELQAQAPAIARKRGVHGDTYTGMLPLLRPTPNKLSGLGNDQERFLPVHPPAHLREVHRR